MRRFMAVVAVFCVAAASPVSAAGIHGSVKDPSGGAVAAAEVLVLTPARAVVATVRTDASGRFGVKRTSHLAVISCSLARRRSRNGPLRSKYRRRRRHRRSDVDGCGPGRRSHGHRRAGRSDRDAPRGPGGQSHVGRRDRPACEHGPRAGRQRRGRRQPAADESDDGRRVRARADRQQGQRLRRRRALLEQRAARRRQHVPRPDRADGLDSIEILRGPNSAEYGSDALGGSIQFLSPRAGAQFRRPRLGGQAAFTAPPGTNPVAATPRSRSAQRQFGLFGNARRQDVGKLRPGDGIDSHAAVTRFFGVASDVLYPDRSAEHRVPQWGTGESELDARAARRSCGYMADAPGRRRALGSAARRRRQPHRRAERPDARPVLRPARAHRRRLVRSRASPTRSTRSAKSA